VNPAAWVICVVLMHPTLTQPTVVPRHRVCWDLPSQQACLHAMNDWLTRAWAWEDRNGLRGSAFAGCSPAPLAPAR